MPEPVSRLAVVTARPPVDPVGLAWLVTVRWTILAAGTTAIIVGQSGLDASPSRGVPVVLALWAASNAWLTWRRAHQSRPPALAAGLLTCADVLVVSWLLLQAGGVLNPGSVIYLVEIVVAALVLGRPWTWIVTALSVAGYAALFLAPGDELTTAQAMHPQIALHLRGMWLAFALTAVVIGVLVTRLAVAVERRDRALDALRDRTDRAARFAGLATLAAGAAHELSTPLATIAVAARELERSLERGEDGREALLEDARLIRAELDRCRRVIDDMAGRAAEPGGESPQPVAVARVIDDAVARLAPALRDRVRRADVPDRTVVWPAGVVALALGNLLHNGLQASPDGEPVTVDVRSAPGGVVRIVVTDAGRGMTADEVARAGEPFFTTKPAGAGTGLGLFVAQSAVEQLGGRLTLASAPQQGTTATVELPIDVIGRRHTDD